jgi:hypothetical protein
LLEIRAATSRPIPLEQPVTNQVASEGRWYGLVLTGFIFTVDYRVDTRKGVL